MNLWTALKHLEKEYDCLIYGILDIQGVSEDLSSWSAFDMDSMDDDFLISSYEIPKQLMLEAFQNAYDNTSCEYDNYNSMLEDVGEYIIKVLKEKQCVCGKIDCPEEYAHNTSGV